jgi:signal transduction histidine kinase
MEHRTALERTAALQATTAALVSAMTLDRIAEVIVSKGLEAVGAYAGSVVLLKSDGMLHMIASAGYDPELVHKFEQFSVDGDFPLSQAIKRGEPVILRSAEERDARFPHLIEARRTVGSGAAAAIPLIIDSRILGGLGINFRDGRVIDDDDVEFMNTLAQQCAQGIERARLYEAEREARALAEEANKAKTDFLTTMSHELRTPLNAIGGYADLLQAGIRGPVTAEQILDLERIKRSQRHLLSLINDVLNFAKLQAGIVQVEHEEFDLDEVASGIEGLIMPQLIQKNLSYRFDTTTERCVCIGDREKVEQIILNLLSNAIKFTESGGTVSVSLICDATSAEVHVTDTGSGISKDKLQAVFEPFVQLNRTKTSTNEGTGLGLSISRDLARAMNGELIVESEVGNGCVFTLRLPRAIPDSAR